MRGWPYAESALKFVPEKCSCGASRATVAVDENWSITACSAMLTGKADGGPKAHIYMPTQTIS
jgi:hypothetical protein